MNSGTALRRCVASAEIAGSTPASRSMIVIEEDVFAGVAERVMHLIRNEDEAGSIPAASSRTQERLYDECNDNAGISAQCEL